MKRIVEAVACMVLATGAAWAEVSFRGGVSGGATLGDTIGTAGGVLERASGLYGAQVVAQITDPFSVELAVMRLSDWDEEERLGVTAKGTMHMTPLDLSIRYAVPLVDKVLSVYGMTGGGYYMFDTFDLHISGNGPGAQQIKWDDPKLDMKNTFDYHVGLGLQWFCCENVELFGEYRFDFIHNRGSVSGIAPTGPEGQYIIDKIKQDWTDNNEIGLVRIGLNYKFWSF